MSTKNKPSIAVCIAGEYRTWNLVCENIFKFFSHVEVDYYFATWNKTNGKPITESDITDTFTDERLIASEVVDYDSIIPPNRVKSGREILPRYMQHNTWRMSNLWHYANFLKKEHEMEVGTAYDHVFLLRPDMVFNTTDPVTYESLMVFDDMFTVASKSPTITFTKHFGLSQVDWAFVASSPVMDIICSFRDYLLHEVDEDNVIPNVTHNMLANYLMERRLVVSPRFTPLHRCEVVKEGYGKSVAEVDDEMISDIFQYRKKVSK